MVAALALLPAPRCRYTVRDVGFVDLAGPTCELTLFAPAAHGLSDSERAVLDGMTETSRVGWHRLEPQATGEVGWVLRGNERAPLPIGGLTQAVDAIVARVASSPLRDALLAESLTSFAFVLFVESGDADADARAGAAIADALESFPELARSLPRPVERPLRRLTLPAAERGSERVLLWSLGLAADESAPVVAVLFGRGRLAGEPLVGDAIAAEPLLARLALVGESCECETDPFLHVRAAVPLAWSERHRQRAAEELGFDPESPFVKAEIATILSRTADAGGRLQLEVGLGYRETRLAPRAAQAPLAFAEPALEPAPRVIEAGAGDWSFADEEPATPQVSHEQDPNEPSAPSFIPPLLIVLGAIVAVSVVAASLVLRTRRERRER